MAWPKERHGCLFTCHARVDKRAVGVKDREGEGGRVEGQNRGLQDEGGIFFPKVIDFPTTAAKTQHLFLLLLHIFLPSRK